MAELREAAAHFERAAALHSAPAVKADLADKAAWCRRREMEESAGMCRRAGGM